MTAALVIWAYAVWHWSGVPETPPKLISQAAYDDIYPQIHHRLRDLNFKLASLFAGQRRSAEGPRLQPLVDSENIR
jgi:hypothetical protein